jgi:uncharacterized protein
MEIEPTFADTNLFLRFLTNDVPEQADAVEALLNAAAQDRTRLVTNPLVIAEFVWTLESFYRLSKETIQAMILAILNTPGLEVVDEEIVLQAIHGYVEKNVDFIDAYNAAWTLKQGIHTAYTFDRKHFERFEALSIKVPGADKG